MAGTGLRAFSGMSQRDEVCGLKERLRRLTRASVVLMGYDGMPWPVRRRRSGVRLEATSHVTLLLVSLSCDMAHVVRTGKLPQLR